MLHKPKQLSYFPKCDIVLLSLDVKAKKTGRSMWILSLRKREVNRGKKFS